MLVGNDFLTWVQDELNRREWKNADFARHAGISEATVSRIMSRLRNPTWTFCIGRDFAHSGSGFIWNNTERDDGALYNSSGQLVSYWIDQ